MRPEAMDIFDSWGERCLLDFEAAKDAGKIVFGIYCTFAPAELVRAAGAVPVSLCGKKQKPIADAEKILPANLCPLIKSSYGYAVTNTCPYFAFSDYLIGETTCDGKVKMYELLGRLKPLYLMNLPRSIENGSREIWTAEIHRLKEHLETLLGVRIGPDELRREIRLHNRMRRALKDLVYLNADGPTLLSSYDMMLVQETKSFAVDLESYIDSVRRLTREMRAIRDQNGPSGAQQGARVLLTGCPVGKGSEKVVRLIEECGAQVVCQENCTGIKSFDLLVDEDGPDPLIALAHRYLQTPCSIMTPNQGRIELLGRLVRDFDADGVIDMTWQCCHTYNVESYRVKEFLENERGVPLLHIETDYSDSDTEMLRTRIEAFLEMLH
ncbi:MAG: double-cubane-cluster-containing anaerobic reductase [Syntrophobacteraceae bacterium]